jgi:hypothetical protein
MALPGQVQYAANRMPDQKPTLIFAKTSKIFEEFPRFKTFSTKVFLFRISPRRNPPLVLIQMTLLLEELRPFWTKKGTKSSRPNGFFSSLRTFAPRPTTGIVLSYIRN